MMGCYLSMLLGPMWVVESFRGRRVDYWICQYVLRLSRRIIPSIACSCVVLQTDDDEKKSNHTKKMVLLHPNYPMVKSGCIEVLNNKS